MLPDPPSPEWVSQRRRWISYRIRALREAQGLTQDQLGERSGMDRKTVNRIERGHRTPDADQLLQIAWGLGVEPGALFT